MVVEGDCRDGVCVCLCLGWRAGCLGRGLTVAFAVECLFVVFISARGAGATRCIDGYRRSACWFRIATFAGTKFKLYE